nr:aminoglycoside phosphotransferase family protein [Actinopolymorpha alba]
MATARHSQLASPRALIDGVVRKATGHSIDSLTRLIVGQMNEVYDVVTDDGRRVIVRISHADDPRFEGECWALDAARDAGVPTPRVLLIEHSARVQVCVEEKLPGVSLTVALDQGTATRATEQVGELLARIHSVPVDGFGNLQPDGRGWPIGFSDIMLDLLPQHDRVAAAARHWDIPSRQAERGLELLAEHSELFPGKLHVSSMATSRLTTSWSTATESAESLTCKSVRVATRSGTSCTGISIPPSARGRCTNGRVSRGRSVPRLEHAPDTMTALMVILTPDQDQVRQTVHRTPPR